MIENIEKRIGKMISSLAREKYEEKLLSLERLIKRTIIEKEILFFLSDSKKVFPLTDLKDEIEKVEIRGRIKDDIIDKLIKLATKLNKDVEFLLKSNINDELSLIRSWERINETFNQKNIPHQKFSQIESDFLEKMKIENILESNKDLPELISNIIQKIEDFKTKKSELNLKIFNYFEAFTDKDFVKNLVNGNELSIKELSPSMYKQLFDSELKDKIVIKLK